MALIECVGVCEELVIFTRHSVRCVKEVTSYQATKLAYLISSWSKVLPEKLAVPQLLKKFPAFYGTIRFITAFTRASLLSLS